MAFPISPITGDQHTEAGILYEWTGASWDVVIETYQELVEANVDPTALDVEAQGTVWRNLSTGLAWEYSQNIYSGTPEWVQIVSDGSVQVLAAPPNTQHDGSQLQDGDIWIDSSNNVISYRTTTATWEAVKISFDNTTAALTGSPTTTQEAIDILASRVSVLLKGLSFYGTYSPAIDFADFITLSGLADGALPAASASNQDTYLIVDAAGTVPVGGVLAGTTMYPGDWVISDGTSWTHLSLSGLIQSFIGHPDTPANYTGAAGKIVKVNSAETGLEFVTVSDTHSIFASSLTYPLPAGPQFRDVPTNTIPLQVGDRWIDSETLNPYVYTGGGWQPIVPVIITSGAQPTQTTGGLLWYNTSNSTLFVRDSSIDKWVGI